MARKASPLEQQLDRLAAMRSEPSSAENCADVVKYLAGKNNLVVAKAARIAGDWNAVEMTPLLLAAFDRFMEKPAATDKGCAAKIEILKALCKMEYPSPAIFRRGLRHVQMEGSFGPPVDTAAEVRALSAIGLAQTRDPDALEEIVPLLLDKECDARIGAVRAIGAAGLPGDVLLLRFKALAGDDPQVMGECFAALLRAEPKKSLTFVAPFLSSADDAVAEAAALAIGESRLEEALEVLRDAFERTLGREIHRYILVAIALLRRENAIDYLLELVENGGEQTSVQAASALETYARDPKVQERLAQAQQTRLRRS